MPTKKAASSRRTSASSRGKAKTTTNHETIRRWVEKRDAHPATVKGTGKAGPGVLRIDFPGHSGKETLKAITWDDFFAKFDREKLAFLYQEKTATGRPSRFCKLVDRDSSTSRSRQK